MNNYQELLDYLDSEEGQKEISETIDKLIQKDTIKIQRTLQHIQKINNLVNRDETLLKLINIYQDMKKNNHDNFYRRKKRILVLLSDYIKNGVEVEDDWYDNCFILNNWKLTILYGQGSYYSIYYNGERLIDF